MTSSTQCRFRLLVSVLWVTATLVAAQNSPSSAMNSTTMAPMPSMSMSMPMTEMASMTASSMGAMPTSTAGGMSNAPDNSTVAGNITMTPETIACLNNPSTPSCADLVLDPIIVKNDVEALCIQMPYMPGCSVNEKCKDAAFSSQPWCNKFSILADVCQSDMPKMKNCTHYTRLCSPAQNASVVKQCKTNQEIPSIPSTVTVNNAVKSICSSMNMDGCSACPITGNNTFASCDLLSTYSQLCLAMPDMAECEAWKTMCTNSKNANLDLPYCSSSNNPEAPPSMIMYFHEGIREYILFQKWVPKDTKAYVGSWFAVFFIAVFYEGLKTLRSNLVSRWLPAAQTTCTGGGKTEGYYAWPKLRLDILRAFFTFIETTISYALMLVVMTFNVGLFFAVITGLTIGTFFLGRYMKFSGQEESKSCETCP